ncbi:IPT/TIG domain-containing protein [Xanthomonas albilineans]|uniref:IPT/TIG domain-containing protein n=1 Tax=Xanthomonas albilineans TaxID=29447 RepID=UPI0005F30711|nr:IPT/TIG domain-containing protein [Xanthomonas albilineans]
MLIGLLLCSLCALATSYVYDAGGRLVAVSNDTGGSARYTYDNIGNLAAVDSIAGQLAIFAFSPGRGAPGTPVTIKGQGFSATASQNAVQFNGVAATVSTASSTELTVVVPSGATTGPIAITVGSATASSAMNFVVDPAAMAPAIDTVSPTLLAIGESVTTTGKALLPAQGQTSTLLNARAVSPTTLSNTTIVFPAPANVGSGKVTVTTPYGSATSAQDVVVVPAGIDKTQIESIKRLTIGAAPQPLSVTTAGNSLAVLYDLTAGDYPSLQFSGLGAVSVSYTVYGPTNAKLASGSVSVASTASAHLPRAATSGTYLVLLKPSQVPATWQLAVEKATPLDVNGTALTQPIIGTAQSKRFLFNAAKGQNLGLGLSDIVTPNARSYMSLQIFDTAAAFVDSQYCYASANGCQVNLSNLAGGTYTVVVSPPYDGDQTMQFTATLSVDLVDSLPLNTAKAMSLTRRGQNARLSFIGKAGQQGLALSVSGQSTAPANAYVYYTVYAPDGAQVNSMWLRGGEGGTLNLSSLPADGKYTLFVDPYYGETANAAVLLSTPISDSTPVDGTQGSYATTEPGQNVYLSFTATAGQNLGFALSDIVTPNSMSSLYLLVRDSSGNALVSQSCSAPSHGCQVNLSNLAVGTYTVVVSPPSDGDKTMQFKATLSTDLADSLSLNTAKAISLMRRGQNVRLSFSGKAGQQGLALNVSGQSTAPANAIVYYIIYAPDGSQLSSMMVTGSGSGTLNLSSLPADGTYTVFVDPSYGETINATVFLSSPITSTMPIDGTPGSYATTGPGQKVSLSFTAMAGQNLGFALSDIVMPNETLPITLQVSDSAGTFVAASSCYVASNGCQVNLSNLAGGTYNVVVSPPWDGDQTMQFKATLSADLADSLPLNTVKAMSLTRRGQNARLSFSGKTGQQGLVLQVSGQSTAPANANVYYTIYAPDGSQLNSMLVGWSGGGTLNLSSLPADGTYTIFVDPYYGETANATVLLSAPINGTTPVDGTPGNYATTVPGQNVYLSFTATAGQNLGFALSDIVTPNAASPIYLQVSDSAGTFVAGKYCYAANNGCQVNLSNLAGGAYTALVSPPSDGDQTMQFKATLSSDLTDSLTLGTAKVVGITRRGQNARLSFSGTAGQQGLALSVSGQSTVPANGHVDYTVYAPDGSQVSSTVNNTVISTSGILNLPKLQMTGTYTVFVDPASGEKANTTVQLSSPMTGTMPVDGTTGIYATTVPGQNVYLSFTATAGQSLGLGLSDIVTPNAVTSMSLKVFDPAGNMLYSQPCYATDNGCQVNLSNLAGGTYTALVSPPWDGDQTMQFKATLSTGLTDQLTPGTAKSVNITRRGQNARLSFNGTAGQPAVTLGISGQTTGPANSVVYYVVYGPDGSQLNSITLRTDGKLNLGTLPATGTYTVFVDPSYGETASATILLSSAITGTLPVDGTPGSYVTTVPGQKVYLSFNATAGQNLGFALSDIVTSSTTSDLDLNLFDPSGNSVDSQGCMAVKDGCAVNLRSLVGGTYTVVVSPPLDGDRKMKFTATLSTDLTDSLTPGTAKAVSLTRRGQNARLSFNGKVGQTLALRVSGETTVPVGRDVHYIVYAPDGSQVNDMWVSSTSGSGAMNLPTLPSDGTYMVFVDPFYGETANATVLLSSVITGTASVDGTPGSYSTTVPGQSVYLSFDVTSNGQSLGFALSDIVTPNSTSNLSLQVIDFVGNTMISQSCFAANNGCQVNLPNLLGGTYSVVVSPPSDGDQTMKFAATLSSDLADSLTLGTAKSVSLTRRGQNARLSFNGTAGQQSLVLNVSGQSTVPAARGVYYTVYAPDGSQLNSASITASGSVNLPKLPATGTYMVFVDPGYGETASASLLLSSSSAITGTVPVDGTSGNYTTTMSGQKVALSFTATAGQNLGFALSDIATPNTTSNLSLQIADSVGNVVGSQTCAAANNGCQVNLSSLKAGTYSAVVSPPTNGNQTMKFTATLSSDLADSLTLGTAKAVSLTRRGQNARLSFSGTAGQQGLTLQVSGQSTVPTARGVYYTVYAPDGSQLNSASVTASGSVNLSKLPTTGTYMVFVDPGYGETASASLLLSSASAITGTVPVNGTPGSYATTAPGQKVALSFTATAGQNLGFALSDIVTSNTTSTIALQITDSAGNAVGSQTCAAANNGCQVNLSNLKASTYSVVVSPPSAGDQTMKFTATLSTDLADSLVPGTAKAVSLTRRGQNIRLSFSGTAGQQGLALRVSGQSTVPASRTVDYTVYAPDGSQLNTQSVATSGTLNLSKLPATGTYTVFVDPHYGETASASVLLASAITGTVVVNGTPGSSATTVPGQKVYLSFTATAGQNLGFALSDVVTSNTTSAMSLQIADPTGNAVSSQTCAAANNGCQVNLSNLKAGTYSVVLSPPPDGDQTMKFTSTLSTDLTDRLVLGTAKAVSLTRRGQNTRLSFSGTAGQQGLVLRVSAQSTVPASRAVDYTVYAPDGSLLNTVSVSASGSLTLSKLSTTGTYTVFVDPHYGETVSSQLLVGTSTRSHAKDISHANP